jgi:allophanate hydrolase
VAERYTAIRDFIEAKPDALHPVIRTIIGGGAEPSAADAFAAYYRLRELQRKIEPVWSDIDVLLTPTAPTIYTIAEVDADPITLNSNLGTYTNYMNLLDLCGVAVPAGFQANGLPFGVTLVAPAFRDRALLPLADALHRAADTGMGAALLPMPDPIETGSPAVAASDETLVLAVCGAHMSGLPLNGELTGRGATLIRTCRSAAKYRFFALEDFSPPRPGMVHAGTDGGHAIDLELWAVPSDQFGAFIAGVPAPLAIGTVELDDGSSVKGFVCEAYAAAGARDISELGSWRAYLAAR